MMDMTKLTNNQAVGLQALLGALRTQQQQPAGQMVDLGHGYRAFVPASGWNQLSGVLQGAAGGALEGALANQARERGLAERRTERDEEFTRRLDLMDAEHGYREKGADSDMGRRFRLMDQEFGLREKGAAADHGRRFEEMDYRFGLGEQGAESDMARRLRLMDQEFGLREKGADSDQARRVDLYSLQGRDKVAEALAAAGVAPSGYPDRAAGLDALAGEMARARREQDAYSRAQGIARLIEAGVPADQAAAMIGGTAAAGAGGMLPANPLSAAGRGVAETGAEQDRLLEQIRAAKAAAARKAAAERDARAVRQLYSVYR